MCPTDGTTLKKLHNGYEKCYNSKNITKKDQKIYSGSRFAD